VFFIQGNLSINDCIWFIVNHSDFSNNAHLNINKGILECHNLYVRPFNKTNFRFIEYLEGGIINCVGLIILEAITTGDRMIYLTNNSITTFNSCVCNFFFFFFILIFS
jgi:hypothetical protein